MEPSVAKRQPAVAKPRRALHGWINLVKPVGISSAAAVGAVKRILRPAKIGHAGTLDPLASGVLPLALGEGTKCVNLLMDARKTYEFTITFGQERATDDAEGEITARNDTRPTRAQIEAVLPRFRGEISQVPPAYSALKVEGKRAYALARAGQEVALAPRDVTIYDLEILTVERISGDEHAAPPPNPPPQGERALAPPPVSEPAVSPPPAVQPDVSGDAPKAPCRTADFTADVKAAPLEDALKASSPGGRRLEEGAGPLRTPETLASVTLRARVSKGTYIRSLGRDIARAAGGLGYISALHRAGVGPFSDATAISLDFLEEWVHKPPQPGDAPWLLPLTAALDDIPALALAEGQLKALRHGQQVMLADHHPDTPQLALLYHGQLVGLARIVGNRLISNRLLNL